MRKRISFGRYSAHSSRLSVTSNTYGPNIVLRHHRELGTAHVSCAGTAIGASPQTQRQLVAAGDGSPIQSRLDGLPRVYDKWLSHRLMINKVRPQPPASLFLSRSLV